MSKSDVQTNNLVIDTGEIRLTINDDPDRVVTFNPEDVIFAEKFYLLMGDFKVKMGDFRDRMVEMESKVTKDEDELPLNAADRIDIMKEVCQYMHEQIDSLFGEGTAEVICQGVVNLDVYAQFVTGLTPFIQKARSKKIQKYTKKTTKDSLEKIRALNK